MKRFAPQSVLWSPSILLLAPILAQGVPTSGGAGADPFRESWFQYGVLGLVLVGIIWAKVLVPGWVYKAEEDRSKAKDAVIAEKDKEIARLRGLMETQTIPMLSRAIVIVERAEGRESWREHQQRQAGGPPGPPPFPLSSPTSDG